MDGWLSVVG
jgi:hypothetical protein